MPSNWNQEKYIKALRYAAEAHLGQTLPASDLPYVVHVAMVAMEVIAALEHESGLDGDLAVQCALLHDVIEDTDRSYETLAAEFGRDVAEGVLALSKSNILRTTAEKTADSLQRIKRQPREIWMVKLADRITNLQPPPGTWSAEKIERYREDSRLILAELGSASPFLAERLGRKIQNYPNKEL
jgi:(p)ppGpp synthase/HD superfamily hydrolase